MDREVSVGMFPGLTDPFENVSYMVCDVWVLDAGQHRGTSLSFEGSGKLIPATTMNAHI